MIPSQIHINKYIRPLPYMFGLITWPSSLIHRLFSPESFQSGFNSAYKITYSASLNCSLTFSGVDVESQSVACTSHCKYYRNPFQRFRLPSLTPVLPHLPHLLLFLRTCDTGCFFPLSSMHFLIHFCFIYLKKSLYGAKLVFAKLTFICSQTVSCIYFTSGNLKTSNHRVFSQW